jgi:hypothetical protein
MSASYDETLPSDLDEARYLLGDTVVDPPEDALRSNELINAALTKKGFALGLAFIADGLVAEFSQEPVKITLSGLAVDYSARVPAWKDLATRMRAAAAATSSAASNELSGGVISLDFQEDLGAYEDLD